MVADGTEEIAGIRPERLLHGNHVALGHPVHKVARVDEVVGVDLRPADGIFQCLKLPPAKQLRAAAAIALHHLVFVRIGKRKMRIGNVQHGKRPCRPRVDMRIGKRQLLEVSSRMERQPRRRHHAANRKRALQKITS